MSNLKIKAEELLHKVTPGHKTGHASSNAGPHDNNAANKLDPSVDSDLDGSRNAGATNTGRTAGIPGDGHHTSTHTSTGSGLTGSSHTGTGTGLTGSSHTSTGSGLTGSSHTGTGSGLTGTTHTGTGHTGSTNAGPHNSNMANKLDPTVDSDLDGSRNTGMRSNNNHGATTAGPHSSNLANKADPRVDSDLSGSHSHNTHNTGLGAGSTGLGGGSTHSAATGTGLTGTHGTGPAPNTAGPHKSDMMNKADPRVDSDLDGSKTTGGNKTYA